MMFDFNSSLFWYKIIFLIEILIAEIIFIAKLNRKQYFVRRAVIAVLSLFVIAFMFPIVAYNAAWTCFMFFAIFFASLVGIKFCYDERWWNIFFCGLAAYTIQHIAFIIYDSACAIGGKLLGIDAQLNVYQQGENLSSSLNAVSVILYIATYFIIYMIAYFSYSNKICPSEVGRLGRKRFVLLAAIILITDNIFNAITTYNENIDIISLWIERGYNVFTCVLSLQLQFSQLTEENIQNKYNTVQHILLEEQKQYNIVKQNLDMVNIKCHDMKHQLLKINKNGLTMDKKEVEEISKVMSIYESVVKTGNETLDLILSEKNLMYSKDDIKITCIAEGALLNFITPTDMYSLFGNALDNAIESVLKFDKSKRTISFFVKRVGNMISIHVENYYEGNVVLINGLPKTTKKDENFHGYGMLSMKTIVEKYNGTLAVELSDNIFSLNMLIPMLIAEK